MNEQIKLLEESKNFLHTHKHVLRLFVFVFSTN